MAMMEELYDGFVEMKDGTGVQSVQLVKDSEGLIYAFVNEELADDVFDAEQFAQVYGRKLYNNLEDFKRGNSVGVERVWV